MMNGCTVGQLTSPWSVLSINLRKAQTTEEKIDALFLSLYSRKPKPAEKTMFLQTLESYATSKTIWDDLILGALSTQRFQYDTRNVKACADSYDDAARLMRSEDLSAFDLTQEPDELRKAYGKDTFGQGCLLARRLVEHGVRFVEVSLGSWDTHVANFINTPRLCDTLDTALAALVGDLERRGLLASTMVVVTSEFGRTPKINSNQGRDHYPIFSTVMMGGGMKYGKTTEDGSGIAEDKVGVPEFNATIGCALGLPLDQVIYSTSKRPFTVADKGQPLLQLFA